MNYSKRQNFLHITKQKKDSPKAKEQKKYKWYTIILVILIIIFLIGMFLGARKIIPPFF